MDNKGFYRISPLASLLNILKFIENPIPVILNTMEEHGSTYRVKLWGVKEALMTADPKLIKHILVTNQKKYYKSEFQTKSLAKYLGYGLLTTNGDQWLRQRRMIQPGFHKQRIIALIDIMNQEIAQYVNQWKADAQQNPTMDITQNMSKLTINVVTKTLYNSELSTEDFDNLVSGISHLQKVVVQDIRQPHLRAWRKINGSERKNQRISSKARSILVNIINERRANNEQYNDLLEMLLNLEYEDTGEGMSNQQIIDESLVFFVAGHETTANALSWALYLLDQHPEVKKKMLDEFKPFLAFDVLNFEQINQLVYTEQVVNEVLRLYPPAWTLDRKAIEDDVFEGQEIKKGTLIALFVYGTQRSKDYWENAEQFDPERFGSENKDKITPYSFFPFGGGPRLCIGQQFATMELKLALFHIYKTLDFSLAPNQTIEVEPLVTLKPKNGIVMKVTPNHPS